MDGTHLPVLPMPQAGAVVHTNCYVILEIRVVLKLQDFTLISTPELNSQTLNYFIFPTDTFKVLNSVINYMTL